MLHLRRLSSGCRGWVALRSPAEIRTATACRSAGGGIPHPVLPGSNLTRGRQVIFVGLLGGFAFAFPACSPNEPPWLLFEGPGSVPTILSENPSWPTGEEWTISSTPILEFQLPSQGDSIPRPRVKGGFRASDGRVFISDGIKQTVRVFDVHGEEVSEFSGPEDAPGGFQNLGRPFRIGKENWAVLDRERARLSVFDFSGRFKLSLGLGSASAGGTVLGVVDDRWILVMGEPEIRGYEAGLYRDSASIVRYEIPSGRPDTLGAFPARERFVAGKGVDRVVGIRPFGLTLPVSTFEDRVFVGDASNFTLFSFSADGTLIATFGRPFDRPKIEKSHRQEYVDWRTGQYLSPAGVRARARAVLSSRRTPYPAKMPALDRIIPDSNGNLWIRNFRPPWLKGKDTWSVFDNDGIWLGDVAFPEGVDVLDIGEAFLLTISQERDKTTVVRVFNLRKPNA